MQNPLCKIEELVPISAGSKLRLTTHNEKPKSRSCETHIHSPNVRDESNAISASRSYRGVEHNIDFFSLEGIDGGDAESSHEFIGMLRDPRFKLHKNPSSRATSDFCSL